MTTLQAWGLVGLATLAAACGGGGERHPAGAPPALLVSTAASLAEAVGAVADRFEVETGIEVRLNVAGSQVLAAQVIEGAPVDLFISADTLQMTRVVEAGRVDPTGVVDLVSNRLVIVVPSDRPDSVATPHDLTGPSIRRIAIGDPAAVPAGVYARQYLETVGLWDRLAGRVVPTSNVRAALRAVEAGTVDAAVVYATDARTSADAYVVYTVPADAGPRIVYPAGVTRDAPNPDGATRFLRYLQTEPATRLFEAAGFVPVGPTPAGPGLPPRVTR